MQPTLIKAEKQHLKIISNWFCDEKSLFSWAGPNFRYPFTEQSFLQDTQLDKLSSHVLVDRQSIILAFGQYYNRLNCCHLGRLVVNPDFRAQGIGQQLINALVLTGTKALGLSRASLFVLEDNHPAVAAYKKYGFEVADYPEKIPIANCLYMRKEISSMFKQ